MAGGGRWRWNWVLPVDAANTNENPGRPVVVVPSIGSGGGIAALQRVPVSCSRNGVAGGSFMRHFLKMQPMVEYSVKGGTHPIVD